MPCVDVVVVAYRSADTLRACVQPLAETPDVSVTVVDNASPDNDTAQVTDLPVQVIRSPRNGGFAAGCNQGIAAGSAPWVLLLNPDARIDARNLQALTAAGEANPRVGVVGPRILSDNGQLAYSQRRFARLRSTFSQALFLHRLAPHAAWSDEMIRDRCEYDEPAAPDWLSGAAMLLRREALKEIGGLDERYFLYREDMDLCRRLRHAGWEVRYDPSATVQHVGGASSRAGETLPIFATSRIAYAREHFNGPGAFLERVGVGLWACTHWMTSVRRPAMRRSYAAALRALIHA